MKITSRKQARIVTILSTPSNTRPSSNSFGLALLAQATSSSFSVAFSRSTRAFSTSLLDNESQFNLTLDLDNPDIKENISYISLTYL